MSENRKNIVQRLRENADLDEMEHANPQVVALEREAADEIERLRRLAKASLDARDKEAAASMAWDNAQANYSTEGMKQASHNFTRAAVAASEADKALREALKEPA